MLAGGTLFDWLKIIFGSGGVMATVIFLWNQWGKIQLRKRLKIEIRGCNNWHWTTPAPTGETEGWKIDATCFWVLVTNLGTEISIKSISMTTRDTGGGLLPWSPYQAAGLPQLLETNGTIIQTYRVPVLLPEWNWRDPLVEVHTSCGKRVQLRAAEFIRQFNETLATDVPP